MHTIEESQRVSWRVILAILLGRRALILNTSWSPPSSPFRFLTPRQCESQMKVLIKKRA
jgi:hypothetical protein